MSSFQDLYQHAAQDRTRAMQFLVIQDIRRRAVREMQRDGVYREPENAEALTEEELSDRRAEGAYAYGLHSILEVSTLPEENGSPAYATAVRDTATKPYCLALCVQTKLEELTSTGAIPEGTDPIFYIIAANDDPNETVQPLYEAIDLLRAAYPQWRFTIETRSAEAAAKAQVAQDLRDAMDAAKKDPKPENTQKLMTLIAAAPLFFPAQRPAGAQPDAGSGVHLQFAKVRAQDQKSYFMAFSDRAHLASWRKMGYVELSFNDYINLILESKDDGLIVDPYVGATLCLTRDHLTTLQQQVELFSNMMETLGDMMPQEGQFTEEKSDSGIDDLLNLPPEEPKKGRRKKKK